MSEDLSPLPSIAELAKLEAGAIGYLRYVVDQAIEESAEDRVYAAATILEHVRDRYDAWRSE